MLKISENFDLISVDEVPQCSPPAQGAGLTSVPVTEFIRTLLIEISRIIVFNIYIYSPSARPHDPPAGRGPPGPPGLHCLGRWGSLLLLRKIPEIES